MPDPTQVTVTAEDHSHHSTHATYVRHQNFPEIRGEGETPEDAARRLAGQLSLALDHAPSQWRREQVQRAIEDVLAFVDQYHCTGPATAGL
ncbi:MAG: hypothetical protein P4L84_34835 [Isosphaeraceae bacterium]|nr:hypothetical protein [Isosphaeraceae bacterium]